MAAPQTGAPTGGRHVQTSMRRFTRVVIVGAIAAFAAVPVFATPASAVTTSVCVFDVLPNPVNPPFPAAVHIQGTAPAGTTVTAFNGSIPLVSVVVGAGGTFSSANFFITPPIDITATFTLAGDNNYSTGCSNPQGLLVVRVLGASVVAQQVQALAFTGSNNTTSFVLIGVTALIVGVVLTVGARRRSRVS